MRLTIKTDQGSQVVQAKRYGLLAIHRRPWYDPDTDSDSWTLTHIPTGLYVQQGSKDDMVALAEALKELDWNWTLETVPPGISRKAREIIYLLQPRPQPIAKRA